MNLTRLRITAVLAGAAAAVALSSCSTTAKEDRSVGPSSSASAAADAQGAHDQDDVMFAQLMIPHHQQAVELAALVPDRSTNQSLIKLAAAISAQQQPEIETMRAALKQWGVNPDEMAHGSGHAGMTMQGMVDDATMIKLEALKGAEFDELWLKSMINHHKGAVAMADIEIKDGTNPDMVGLAKNIVSAQEAEIDQMTSMQTGLGVHGG
ncbi:MAG: DUF305 domain-containing protein [Mycobacterium sp.]|nr:DUF305 domain-containing protein [Mycobacterium sp.]